MLYPIFTVRNHLGQLIGKYAARNAAHAISRAQEELDVTAMTFRKSQPSTKLENCTATIEKK